MNVQAGAPYPTAIAGVLRCVATTIRLLVGRRTHLRREHLGRRLRFADGTSAPVFRETIVDGQPVDPCVLVVRFRLRFIRGFGHALFRAESLLNTPLFVGFPGFISKLWIAEDEQGSYRGVYQWDGPERAERYARCLWRVLAVVAVPGSIGYIVLPDLRRDAVLADPRVLAPLHPAEHAAWWRVVGID